MCDCAHVCVCTVPQFLKVYLSQMKMKAIPMEIVFYHSLWLYYVISTILCKWRSYPFTIIVSCMIVHCNTSIV